MAEDPFIRRAQRLAVSMMRRSLLLRSAAYKRLFAPGGTIGRDAEIVLADLRNLGFAQKSTFHPDPYEHGRRAGRREMWLRIVQHLNLDEERVQKLVELEDYD
jgi:hypothetical protein